MINFITINPTQHRQECFNVKGFKCSRWEVDFYLDNEIYEQGVDDEKDRYNIVSLQFTAYDLKQETPEQAYIFLQKALTVLVSCYVLGEDYPDYGATFSQNINLEEIATDELKQVLHFIEQLLGVQPVFTSSNIDKLREYTYLYYSSVKWLDYPFHNGCNDYTIFEDMEAFENLLHGRYELKHYLNANLY